MGVSEALGGSSSLGGAVTGAGRGLEVRTITGDVAPQWPVTIPSLPVHREHHDRVLHDGAHTGLSCGLFHL